MPCRPRHAGAAAVAAALVTVGGAAVAAAAPAAASTVTTVNCSTDSLQAALDAAASGNTLDVTGTCTGKFTISTNLTIIGPATLEGQNSSGTVLLVEPGTTVTLEDLTVQDGVRSSLFLGRGGGIYNNGTLTLDGCSVQNNAVSYGGGIYNNGGRLTLANSSVQHNTARFGGGIYNSGTVALDNSSVEGNTGYAAGGGIVNLNGGTVTLGNSVVRGNSTGLDGGGINNGGYFSPEGTVALDNSSVQGNTAYDGGGIDNFGALTLGSSSVKGNTAGGSGGGILRYAIYGATLSLNDSVVKNNTPDDIFTF